MERDASHKRPPQLFTTPAPHLQQQEGRLAHGVFDVVDGVHTRAPQALDVRHDVTTTAPCERVVEAQASRLALAPLVTGNCLDQLRQDAVQVLRDGSSRVTHERRPQPTDTLPHPLGWIVAVTEEARDQLAEDR